MTQQFFKYPPGEQPPALPASTDKAAPQSPKDSPGTAAANKDYFKYPTEPVDRSIQMTHYAWLTSDHPAARQWRKEADIGGWNRVYDRLASEGTLSSGIYIPARKISWPPTTRNQYFNVPRED